MTRRLATTCFIAMSLIGISSLAVLGQSDGSSGDSSGLKDLGGVSVVVENLSPAVAALGLTGETIQKDVESKLRLGGVRIATRDEGIKLPGSPFVYVRVTLTDDSRAASIDVELDQDVRLERNGRPVPAVPTWQKSTLLSNSPTAQDVRDQVKDQADQFLGAWLSANPNK